MSVSGTSPARATSTSSRPKTVEKLLDREEALALQRISETVARVGDDLLGATDLRGKIRRHPFLAAGLGAGLGFVAGHLVLRTIKRAFSSPSRMSFPGARAAYDLAGLVVDSLGKVRAGP